MVTVLCVLYHCLEYQKIGNTCNKDLLNGRAWLLMPVMPAPREQGMRAARSLRQWSKYRELERWHRGSDQVLLLTASAEDQS